MAPRIMHNRFNEMLQKYRDGTLSEKDKAKMDAWIDALETRDQDVTWTEQDQRVLFQKIKARIATKQMSVNTSRSSFWLKVAATVAVLVTTSYLLVLTLKPNAVEKTFLQDGSIVWLTSGSKLSYIDGRHERRATLVGEALFEIAKEDRPFTIECNKTKVRVVGTSFTLRSQADNFDLHVLTGRVQVWTGRDTINVIPDQHLRINATEDPAAPVTGEERPRFIANTQYDMKFSDTDMATVMKRIEGKFDVAITADDNKLGRCRITADFTDHSLEKTLQLITEILDVEFVLDNKSIRLSGNGCHNTGN